jgi:hypothetical protein
VIKYYHEENTGEVSRCCDRDDPVETTRRLLSQARESELKAYLLGALHDATYSRLHQTYRYSQSSQKWLELLQTAFQILGYKSWIYKEGRDRFVWILETSTKLDKFAKPSDIGEKIAYIRGYFDAEGGMPKSNSSFLYFQFSQKDKTDLSEVKEWLEQVGIKCGVIHNPSKKVDPNYWRFFISRVSHQEFMKIISSWHPRKRKQMELRMKI